MGWIADSVRASFTLPSHSLNLTFLVSVFMLLKWSNFCFAFFYSIFSNLFSALGATPRERFALADFSPTVARNGKETNGSCGATFQCLQRAWNAKGTRPGIVAWCYHTTHISQCRGKVFFCGAMRVPTIEWWKRFPFFIISCFFWHTYSGRERSKKTHTHKLTGG